MTNTMNSIKKVYFISLGCAKNRVDSEHMLGLLEARGCQAVSRLEDADAAVINTCGFIQAAVEETIDTILDVCSRKGKGSLKKIFVVGCFVQRYGYKLLREMPEVDGWLGTGEIYRIAEILDETFGEAPHLLISRPRYLADHHSPRVQTTPFYSAYLKLAEGCSLRCSYCLIPALTGPLRSKSPQSIVVEAQELVIRGVKEINLVAQDTTMYGHDLDGHIRIEDLLDRLLEIQGLTWLRLLYCHPQRITDRLLYLLEENNALCPYLDIPFQHVDRTILERMGRGGGEASPRELIEIIRSKTSHLALRTSLMVGFPGETDRDFQDLVDFVLWAGFDHLGTFIFSPEKGTPAARFKDPVPHDVARERRDTLMAVQREISTKKNQEMIQKTVPVLVEGLSEETDLLLKGRTRAMAPDVDGQVLINKGKGMVGDIVPVLITEAHAYDLVGEII